MLKKRINSSARKKLFLKNYELTLLKEALDSVKLGLVIYSFRQIEYVNMSFCKHVNMSRSKLLDKTSETLLPELRLSEVLLTGKSLMQEIITVNGSPLVVDAAKFRVEGKEKVIAIVQLLHDLEEISSEFQTVKDLNRDIKTIFEASYDVIYVSDSQGTTLRVSSACERLFGYKQEELIGRTIMDLEREGVYTPSATKLALAKKQKVSVVQETKTGKRLLVLSVPIFDEKNEIVRVINASRDITEVSKLQAELKETKELLEEYKKDVMKLRKEQLYKEKMVFKSAQMQKLINLAIRIADFDSTILILGETGVGKEVLAETIHNSSSRCNNAFIKINCGAIPENLLESELFGFEKGAFTGAVRRKVGLFEQGNKGTVFLDEIGEVSLTLQVKLLRFLQEKEFTRVGGVETIKVDARIIAATNRDLKKMVLEGRFREDLYYRLNIVPLVIPPLRERKEDILVLLNHFLECYNSRYLKKISFTSEAMNILISYAWPGNVRELENTIERLVITNDDDALINTNDLPDVFNQYLDVEGIKIPKLIPLKDAIAEVEEKLISKAMEKCKTTTEAAKILGISQSSVSRKLRKMKKHNF